ncbi:MAG: D-glycerate dehydrogenase [Phycisphaeraceae bacterium]|nr:MAG: D-glycerate dehydrogenase [Phycisphaeraceae bacterium]
MTLRPIIAVTRALPGSLNLPNAEIRPGPQDKPDRDWVLRHIAGTHAVVTMFSDKVDSHFLDAAGPNLRIVANFAVGYDNIDLSACRARGVAVSNTPHAVTEGTADLAWLLILAAARHLPAADRFARSGQWAQRGTLAMNDFLGQDLTGKTLLIVGAGRIGHATALRSLGWGMRILYTARSKHWDFELAPLAATRVPLDEGLAQADAVSIHCPLTPETKHLINRDRLALMKPTAILVNTARGPVVDEHALADALATGRLYAAGLDVFEHEPQIHPALTASDRVVMTPHIGSAAARYREMMTAMVADNIAAALAEREPPNRVA